MRLFDDLSRMTAKGVEFSQQSDPLIEQLVQNIITDEHIRDAGVILHQQLDFHLCMLQAKKMVLHMRENKTEN